MSVQRSKECDCHRRQLPATMSQIKSFPPSQLQSYSEAHPAQPKPKRTNFTVSKVALPVPLLSLSTAAYRGLKWVHRAEAGMCATINDAGDKVVMEVIKGSELIHQIVLTDLTPPAKAVSKLIFSKVSVMFRYPYPFDQDFRQPFTMRRMQLTLPAAQLKTMLNLITPYFPPAEDDAAMKTKAKPKLAGAGKVPGDGATIRAHPYVRMQIQDNSAGIPPPNPNLQDAPAIIQPSPLQLPTLFPNPGTYSAKMGEMPMPKFSPQESVLLPPPRQPTNVDSLNDLGTHSTPIPISQATTPPRREAPLISFDSPQALASTSQHPPLQPFVPSLPHPDVQGLARPCNPEHAIVITVRTVSGLYGMESDELVRVINEIVNEDGFADFVVRIDKLWLARMAQ